MTTDEKQKIRELTLRGVPTELIAKTLHYAVSSVKYHRRKMGLFKPKDYCDAQH